MAHDVSARAATRRTVGAGWAVAAAAAGFAAGVLLWPQGSTATPRTVEGWAEPNAAGTAIGLYDSPQVGSGEGYVVAGAWWTGPDGVTHGGDDAPSCIGAGTGVRTHVELEIVTVDMPDGSSWDQVVQVRCLE